MPVLGAAYMPHPPIVIPEVGKGDEVMVEKTASAMRKVGEEINTAGPHTIVCFSPHGTLQPDYVGWAANPTFVGDLGGFGAPEVNFEYKNNLDLVERICTEVEHSRGYEHPGDTCVLDHGALVPLYYVDSNNNFELVYGGYSYRDAAFHFEYGKHLGGVLLSSDNPIYIIGSGDLSHRLAPNAPAEYNEDAHLFDERIVSITKNNNWEAVLDIPEDLLEKAGECGLRSFAMFAGLMRRLELTVEVLSYEGPFGVGYMVAKS